MNENSQLKSPEEILKKPYRYKDPCGRLRDDPAFHNVDDFDECDKVINKKTGDKCGAPKYCHYSSRHPLCQLTQEKIESNEAKYMTTNRLCIGCLSMKVCCLVDAHPSSNSSQSESEEVTLNFTTEGDEYIKLGYSENFIKFLKQRYATDFPEEKVFIRQCYKEIYPILKKNSIITGVPGIGKSAFLHYILYSHLLNEETRIQSFALSLNYQQFTLFEYLREAGSGKGAVYRMKKNQFNTDCEGVRFCVNDYKEELENPQLDKTLNWFLSSPNPKRFKLAQVQSKTIFMPVWSLDELKTAFPLNSLKLKLFELFGGVPRNIIRSEEDYTHYEALIVSDIDSKGKELMENFSGVAIKQLADTKMSYRLVFINPTWDDSLKTFNYFSSSLSFASHIIESKLYQNHKESFINNYLEIFRQDVVDFKKLDNINKIFEKAFLYLAPPAQNKQHLLTSIMHYSEIIFKYFSYSSDIFFFNSNFTDFQMNTFYAPINENYESVDGFCLRSEIIGTKSRPAPYNVLYLFQVTTSKRHPVKLNGLKVVRDHYITRDYTINEYRLVFVVPKGSQINEQKIESYPPPTNSQPNSASATVTSTVNVTAAETAADTAFVSKIFQYKWIINFNPEDLDLLSYNTGVYLDHPSQLLSNNEELRKRKQSSSNEEIEKKISNINLN